MAAALDRGRAGRDKQEICANYVAVNDFHASYLTDATVIARRTHRVCGKYSDLPMER